MDESERERRLADIAARCARLAPDEQERALDAFAQVLTLVELPRGPGETAALSISLERAPQVAYPSG
jgi:hypothetical protein